MAKKRTKTSRLATACKLVQLLARLRETDCNGRGRCVSCGKLLDWRQAQGGHFQAKGRNYNAACTMEENVHLQCSRCNLTLGGASAGYSQWMYATYPEDVIEEIKKKSFETLGRDEIEERIIELRKMCRELAKTKNFVVKVP